MEKGHVELRSKDKQYLEGLLSKGALPAKVFKRATALLELNRGKSYGAVAETLGVCYLSVSNWGEAYRQEGLQMLQDKPRSGQPVEIDGKQRAKITALACSAPPEGHSHWSLRLLAGKVVELGYCAHLSRDYARVILKKMNSSRT
jgi:putative transposase